MPAVDKLDKFYHSRVWKKTRLNVVHMYRGICQMCGKKGTEVHHKIALTIQNVDDPLISLSPDNLTLLCRSCHDAIRSEGSIRNDLMFDENGDVVPRIKHTPPFKV